METAISKVIQPKVCCPQHNPTPMIAPNIVDVKPIIIPLTKNIFPINCSLAPNDFNKAISRLFWTTVIDKDARILLCKNFLINLDELSSLAKKEINTLKSYFSKDQINERLPYDRKNTILPRISSFIGSTNRDTFLDDETGSVRWLCFQITGINWNYRQEINIDLVSKGVEKIQQIKNRSIILDPREALGEQLFEYVRQKVEKSTAGLNLKQRLEMLHRFFMGELISYPGVNPMIKSFVKCWSIGSDKECTLFTDVSFQFN